MPFLYFIDIQKIKLKYFIKMCGFDTLIVRKRTICKLEDPPYVSVLTKYFELSNKAAGVD